MMVFSVWVMMNKLTRRELSKIPEEVQREIELYFVSSDPVVEEDSRKLTKLDNETADFVRSGLSVSIHFCTTWFFISDLVAADFLLTMVLLNMQPRWSDLDINQHVNNVKYIGWILEVDIVILSLLVTICLSPLHCTAC